jgi:hypothetical protein
MTEIVMHWSDLGKRCSPSRLSETFSSAVATKHEERHRSSFVRHLGVAGCNVRCGWMSSRYQSRHDMFSKRRPSWTDSLHFVKTDKAKSQRWGA